MISSLFVYKKLLDSYYIDLLGSISMQIILQYTTSSTRFDINSFLIILILFILFYIINKLLLISQK